MLPEHPLMDGLRYFHSDVTGYALDFLYHMCSAAAGAVNEDVRGALSSAARPGSAGPQYVERLIETSLQREKLADTRVTEEEQPSPILKAKA